ncbi:hypothetical protein DPMN_041058 [Dreissena polymorpha]|uniref:Uncharacterized protein n=1 Tax=Dreissena polymorpha TaxID=45954 RepID=A0A9D4HVR8_DREPO|nr:hypothetical protein DPMN_041058 [Dreissena polymorpha]
MDVDQLKRLFRSVERHIGTLKDATGALENLLSSTDKTAVRNSVGNVRQIGTTLQEECRDIQQFLQLCDGQPETHLNSPSSLTYAKQLRDIEVENHPLDPGGADGIDGVFHIASPVDLEMRVDHMYEEFQSMRHYIKRLVPTLSRTSVERRIQELSHEPQDAIIERCRKNEDMVGAELDKAKADLEARETELDKLRCELERCARPEEKRELQKKEVCGMFYITVSIINLYLN